MSPHTIHHWLSILQSDEINPLPHVNCIYNTHNVVCWEPLLSPLPRLHTMTVEGSSHKGITWHKPLFAAPQQIATTRLRQNTPCLYWELDLAQHHCQCERGINDTKDHIHNPLHRYEYAQYNLSLPKVYWSVFRQSLGSSQPYGFQCVVSLLYILPSF